MRGLIIFLAGALLASSPSNPQSRMDEPLWAARFAAKKQELRRPGINLVFLGDSITAGLQANVNPDWGNYRAVWDKYYACRTAVNLGFAGDTTANLLWRIHNGELDGIQPKVVVLLVGTNNMKASLRWSAETTTKAIEDIVREIKERLPASHLLLLSLLPREGSPDIDGKIVAVNAALQQKYVQSSVTYLDIGNTLLHDGKIDRSLYREAMLPVPKPVLHPDAQGWEKMAAAIEPTISQYLRPCATP